MSELDKYKPDPIDRFEENIQRISNAARLIIGDSVDIVPKEDLRMVGDYVQYSVAEIARLRKEAETDHLTGLRTRKALPAAFYEHGLYAAEHDRFFVCLFGDLRKLKYVNDNRGHKAGDDYLVVASNILQSWAGDDFEVFRWGGDEFSIVGTIPNMGDETHIKVSLNAYRNGLQTKATQALKDACEDPEMQEVIGISVGGVIVSPWEVKQVLFALHSDDTSIEDIIEIVHDEADKSMYEDKLRDNKEVYDSRPRVSPFVLPR